MTNIYLAFQSIHHIIERNTRNINGSVSNEYNKSFTNKFQRWVLTVSHIFCVCNSDEGKLPENVIQTYISCIIAHAGRSIAILSDSGTEIKNKVLNVAYHQLDMKRLFSTLFHPQGNAS